MRPLIGLFLALTLLLPVAALAKNPDQCWSAANPNALVQLPTFGDPECQTFDVIVQLFKNITNVMISFVLAITLIFLVITGYQFVVSMGNKTQLEDAKRSILFIIIGLLVVLSSYLIVDFLSDQLL